ncbi:MAG: hypothetical protein C4581_11595 [Nitrospiraceae bacterium]|nr:MAG: hypothetical protein C4581_11595 [Nitrospiraceae bacterium]
MNDNINDIFINIRGQGNILLIKLRLYHAMTDKRKEIDSYVYHNEFFAVMLQRSNLRQIIKTYKFF